MAYIAAVVSMHATYAYAHNDCIRRLRQMTWTMLIWLAQAAFDLFTWVLLVVLFVTRSHQPGHDHPPADRSPPQDGRTLRIRRSGG